MVNSEIEILLIEDSMNDAELAIRALKKNNLVNNITHLKDGVEAIDFLFGTGDFVGRDINIRPKIILLDLKMPKMNGFEVLMKVKSDKRTQTIPVIVLTSSRESPDIEKAFALGANSYIVKPVEFSGFTKAITELGYYWMVLNQGVQ